MLQSVIILGIDGRSEMLILLLLVYILFKDGIKLHLRLDEGHIDLSFGLMSLCGQDSVLVEATTMSLHSSRHAYRR